MDLEKIKSLVELDKAADRSEEEKKVAAEKKVLNSYARKLGKWSAKAKTWLETIDYLYTHGYKKELEDYTCDELRVNGLVNNAYCHGDLFVSYYQGKEKTLRIDNGNIFFNGKKWQRVVTYNRGKTANEPLRVEDYKRLLEKEECIGGCSDAFKLRYTKTILERFDIAYNGFMAEFERKVKMKGEKAGVVH